MLAVDDEWVFIESLLEGKNNVRLRNPQRELLTVILNKLATVESWKKIPKGDFSMTDLTSAFHRWTASGRFERVLDFLRTARGNNGVLD